MIHKCFISYHRKDYIEVNSFIDSFSSKSVFITSGVGLNGDELINSNDAQYIMRRIREEHLKNTSITIVMIGKCTWARRFIDWEIASTLRNDPINKRSGLLAINLPSMGNAGIQLPRRLADNTDYQQNGSKYAKYYVYPQSENQLIQWIDDAYNARTTRSHLIVNTRELMANNKPC